MTDTEEAGVVVIRSGMGGLAAARAIAQFGGRRVLVLEQQSSVRGSFYGLAATPQRLRSSMAGCRRVWW